jgi:rhamnosyl/mannosyltransferase
MRILQLGKYYFPYMGGIETHLKELCQSLRGSANIEVLVCAQGRYSREEVAGIDVTRVTSLGRLASTEICPGLVTELSERSYDILHLHAPNPMAMLAYLAARKPRTHRLVVTHHSDTIRQVFLRRAFQPIFERVMRRADAVVATTRRYLESSHELRPYRAKAVVVPYGIDTRSFGSPDRDKVQEIRKVYDSRLVLAVGRLIYYKGFDVLIRAMTSVDATVLVIGGGPLRPDLERLAGSLGLENRVRFLGDLHNDQIRPYYAAADVFVLPSIARSEAFGIVQIEAMAAGLPVINTDLDSGVPEVSLNQKTGFTVAPGDPGALAVAINHLLSDASLRESLGQEGQRRAAREFDTEMMSQRLSELYVRLLRTMA